MAPPFITFLSDYGLQDEFVGICHGVIARICPEARVIDLSHGIPRHDVRAGAAVLEHSLAYVPDGIFLAVVDPDVGARRRAVALKAADGRILVGPDNGLLWPAAQAAGGITIAVDIARSRWRLEPVSATFHGRDIFAPVVAHLTAGVALGDVGDPLDPAELIRIEATAPRHEGDTLVAHVRSVDRFGNLSLDVGHEDLAGSGLRLGRAAGVKPAAGEARDVTYARTFADVAPGQPLLYQDSSRRLSLAVNHGDASAWLPAKIDDEVWITPG
jgi:S-adenosyl-L-methionine hydrolase (adenosine-forming)